MRGPYYRVFLLLVCAPRKTAGCKILFTTRTPAVTDVFGSGRNVGALRPARHVGFRSPAPVAADDIPQEHIIFVMPTALKLLKLGPNSERGK